MYIHSVHRKYLPIQTDVVKYDLAKLKKKRYKHIALFIFGIQIEFYISLSASWTQGLYDSFI